MSTDDPRITFESTIGGPTGECPKHGEVSAEFHVYASDDPSYSSPKICPKCFVDFITENVTKVTPHTLPGAPSSVLLM